MAVNDYMTTVSVLTPSLGYGRFIADALDCVHQCGLDSIEHVVQDGGSTDSTTDVLEQFESRGGLKWRSEPDRGQSDALNKALSRASGRWVAWLNADEFYLPGGLEALIAAGDSSDADVVYGDAVFTDEAGQLLRLLPQHRFSRTVLRWYGTSIASCAMIVRREALGIAPWDPDLRLVMDWDLYLKLMAAGSSFAYVPRPIGAFRVHEGRVSAQPLERHAHEFGLIRARYGIPSRRRLLGRSLHGAYKAMGGAYRRQLAARPHKGDDLRWFRSETGARGWLALLARVYPEAARAASITNR